MYRSSQQTVTITKKKQNRFAVSSPTCHCEVSLCFFAFIYPNLAPSIIFFFRLNKKQKQTTIERRKTLTKITKV